MTFHIGFWHKFGNLAISGRLGFDELESWFLVLMSLKVFASNLSQLLFILKLATFLQPLEVLYLHNVYYLKLSLIILIYYVTFTDLILEKGFMKVENIRI